MKKVLIYLFMILSIILLLLYTKEIKEFSDNLVHDVIPVSIPGENEYTRKDNFHFVKITDDFAVKNRQHLYDIIYTYLDSGADSFHFKCDKSFKECHDTVEKLTKDQNTLTVINYFVHPFNSFEKINIKYNSIGAIEIKVKHNYSKEEIKEINKKVDEVIKTHNLDQKFKMSKESFMREVHDYIINNASYDKENLSGKNNGRFKSASAYGPLIQNKAICSGYSDAFSIFMHRYKIKNYKVVSDKHTWNAVNLDNKYLHVDLTWDDPVTKDNKDVLSHQYFLIDTKILLLQDKTEHAFDLNIYQELK